MTSSPTCQSAKKKTKLEADQEVNIFECIFCFESVEDMGLHRPANLACGHHFGKSCLEQWFARGSRHCPVCNAKAQASHIRPTFPTHILAVDSSQVKRFRATVDKAREEMEALKAENARLKAMLALKDEAINDLKLHRQEEVAIKTPPSNEIQFILKRKIPLPGTSHALVLDSWEGFVLVLLNKKVLRISLVDWSSKPREYILSKESGNKSIDVKPNSLLMTISPHPDDGVFALSQDNRLQVHETMTGKLIFNSTHDYSITCLVFDKFRKGWLLLGSNRGDVIEIDYVNQTNKLLFSSLTTLGVNLPVNAINQFKDVNSQSTVFWLTPGYLLSNQSNLNPLSLVKAWSALDDYLLILKGRTNLSASMLQFNKESCSLDPIWEEETSSKSTDSSIEPVLLLKHSTRLLALIPSERSTLRLVDALQREELQSICIDDTPLIGNVFDSRTGCLVILTSRNLYFYALSSKTNK